METTLIRLMVSYDSKTDDEYDHTDSVIQTTEKLLSERYGGVTRYEEGSGVWYSDDGTRHEDPVTVLESACIESEFSESHLRVIQQMLSANLDQEAVLAYTEQIETHMYER